MFHDPVRAFAAVLAILIVTDLLTGHGVALRILMAIDAICPGVIPLDESSEARKMYWLRWVLDQSQSGL